MGESGLGFDKATAGYEEEPQAKLCNETCVDVFNSLHSAKPGAFNYIFEIGSGTGGTTSFVLPTFNPHSTKYVFSDLSQAFLTNARSRFAVRFPFVEYAIFNGDKHPGDQGFNSYEMTEVLATNVIHATQHLASTLATIHILLQPGGHLVFNEVQNPGTVPEDLTYGLTDGWWMLTDTERRVTYPLLRVPEWNNLFNACQFRPVWHTPDQGEVFSQQAVLVAQCTPDSMLTPNQVVDPVPRADPNASYLFTGAVGGLGLIAALIMIERGAQYLHFVSRRDRVPVEATTWYNRIAESGANIKRERCNCGNAAEMARLFVDTPGTPACQGFVHGAGVLSDGTITRQARHKYADVFAPKYYGAWHLHRFATHKAQKLQLSVMFSSGAGFFGSPGQSNHSAANAGIEGLADMSCQLGLPGGSIAWGAVAEVGYAARHHIAEGINAVSFEHAWAVLEALQARPSSVVAISPNAWAFGMGALPMKAAMYAGSEKRYRRAGVKLTRTTQHSSPVGEPPPPPRVEEKPAAAAAAVVEAPMEVETRAVFAAMQELHGLWQVSGGAVAGGGQRALGSALGLGLALGQQEVC